MSVPYYKEKPYNREITGPDAWAAYLKGQGRFADFIPPPQIVFTWQRSFFNGIKSRYAHRSCKGFIGDVILLDGRRSHEAAPSDKPFEPILGVAGNFGIGAPAAVLLMESLVALGVRRFVGMGTAGGLIGLEELDREEGDRSLHIGSIILAEEALRDEGTSYHYLKEGQPAKPDKEQFDHLSELMIQGGFSFQKSSVWTTDALFRETAQEVAFYLEQGVKAVDMEASALFACAEKRKASMASLFVISDILTTKGWAPDFKHDNIRKTLDKLLELVGDLS